VLVADRERRELIAPSRPGLGLRALERASRLARLACTADRPSSSIPGAVTGLGQVLGRSLRYRYGLDLFEEIQDRKYAR